MISINNLPKKRIAWNRGIKTGLIPRSAFKKGQNLGENHPNWKGGFKKCIDCGEKVKSRYAIRCRKCFFKFNKGIKHPKWKGGWKNNLPRCSCGKQLTNYDAKMCHSCYFMGEKNPRWKDGISSKEGYSSLMSGKRRAREKQATGSHTLQEWELLKKQYGFTCPCCGKKEPEILLTEDHIIPLIKGGSNYIENIQPLCRSCNSKKHIRIITFIFDKVD